MTLDPGLMPEYLAGLRAVLESPADDFPRLMLADWLDEHGEGARAELIRVQCDLARDFPTDWPKPLGSEGRYEIWRILMAKEADLVGRHRLEWLPAPLMDVEASHAREVWQYRRGFPWAGTLSAEDWLRIADRVHWSSDARCGRCDDGMTKAAWEPVAAKVCPHCGKGSLHYHHLDGGNAKWCPVCWAVTFAKIVEPPYPCPRCSKLQEVLESHCPIERINLTTMPPYDAISTTGWMRRHPDGQTSYGERIRVQGISESVDVEWDSRVSSSLYHAGLALRRALVAAYEKQWPGIKFSLPASDEVDQQTTTSRGFEFRSLPSESTEPMGVLIIPERLPDVHRSRMPDHVREREQRAARRHRRKK